MFQILCKIKFFVYLGDFQIIKILKSRLSFSNLNSYQTRRLPSLTSTVYGLSGALSFNLIPFQSSYILTTKHIIPVAALNLREI